MAYCTYASFNLRLLLSYILNFAYELRQIQKLISKHFIILFYSPCCANSTSPLVIELITKGVRWVQKQNWRTILSAGRELHCYLTEVSVWNVYARIDLLSWTMESHHWYLDSLLHTLISFLSSIFIFKWSMLVARIEAFSDHHIPKKKQFEMCPFFSFLFTTALSLFDSS